VRPGFELTKHTSFEVRLKRALRRLDLPTLLRPRKATSGVEDWGKARNLEAEKMWRGELAEKWWEA